MQDISDPAAAGAGRDDAGSVPADRAGCIPWLDGSLLRYLAGGSVLDVKAQRAPAGGPVVPGAAIAILGEDGSPLDAPPIWDRQFDAVFSRDALAVADDPAACLVAWFDAVRPEGFLVLVLTRAPPPGGNDPAPCASHAEAAFTRSAAGDIIYPGTTEDLRRLVQTSLPAGRFDIVQLDEAPGRGDPAHGTVGCTDIRLVLCKPAQAPSANALQPGAPQPGAAPAQGVADAAMPFLLIGPGAVAAPGLRPEGDLLIRDFGPASAGVARILVLKLDHHGDFIIGLPALRDLRRAFPDAFVRLVCGPWNVAAARSCGLVDDVRRFDFFPERAADWRGSPAATDWDAFLAATEGSFDLAIDLRVDEDTRHLLGRVDAGLRCGIGSQAQFPLLDIALPEVSREMVRPAWSALGAFPTERNGSQLLGPDAFSSDMDIRTPSFHESGFVRGGWCWMRSRPVFLPMGRYSAAFDIAAPGFIPGPRGVGVYIEILQDGDRKIAARVFGRFSIRKLDPDRATLEFDSPGIGVPHEFLVRTLGRPLAGRLRFSALRLRWLDVRGGRFRPSELHVGEKLSLLISLIRQRVLAEPISPGAPKSDRQADQRIEIVVAPFSNSAVRDWPAAHYAALISRLTAQFDCHVRLVGSPAQAAQAAALMQMLASESGMARVTDDVGKTQWSDLPAILAAADLVICNNSGIAHQAAALGARTLAIYSASHQPMEWGQRGPRSRAIMLSVSCSPCGYERLEECPNGHACMQMITPEMVLGQIVDMLGMRHPPVPDTE